MFPQSYSNAQNILSDSIHTNEPMDDLVASNLLLREQVAELTRMMEIMLLNSKDPEMLQTIGSHLKGTTQDTDKKWTKSNDDIDPFYTHKMSLVKGRGKVVDINENDDKSSKRSSFHLQTTCPVGSQLVPGDISNYCWCSINYFRYGGYGTASEPCQP